jgi:homoserine acetyltransferase
MTPPQFKGDYQTYKLGDFKLKTGGEIPDAFIAYKTMGNSSMPAVIYPTWYSGRKYINVRLEQRRISLTDHSHIGQPLAHWLR